MNLIQDYAEEPARIKGTFKNDFEMIANNLSIVYDMVYSKRQVSGRMY